MPRRPDGESGAILIIFMVALTVATIALTAAVQAWSTTWRRENEEELIFRGQQYVLAIAAYRKEHGGQFPLTLEDLYKPGPRRLRYIRRLYKEPIAPDGKWGLLYLMPGGQGIYDPKAAQKAQEKASREWGHWETAGTGSLAQGPMPPGQMPGVTPIGQNPLGTGVPGTGGMPAGSMPPMNIQGNLPGIPTEPRGGQAGEEERVSEPPIGWPIVGVISRAGGKLAEKTFRIYKGHEKVDEWQFTFFDTGEQLQQPGSPVVGGVAPRGVGPGFGGRPQIQGINDGGGRGPMGGFGPGARPGGRPMFPGGMGGQRNFGPQNPGQQYPGQQYPGQQYPWQQYPGQQNPWPYPGYPPGQYPPGWNPGMYPGPQQQQQNQGNNPP